MKAINYILIIFIGLGVGVNLCVYPSGSKSACLPEAFGQIELHKQREQPVDETTKLDLLSAFGKVPLHFVVNHGQFPDEVIYYRIKPLHFVPSKSEGATIYCTEQGLVFGFAMECNDSVIAKDEATIESLHSNKYHNHSKVFRG